MPNPPVRDKLPASPVSSTRQDISPKVAKAPPTTTAQPPALAPRPTAPAAPAAPPYTAPQPQFHRFRLTDFNRAENPPNQAPAPAGQCSRFRLNDFVPYGSSFEPPPPAPLLPANGVNGDPPPPPHTGGGGGGRRPSPILVPGGQGSFGVMHMDLDSSGPQKTSSSVAAAAGSGRGILQKVNVPILQQQAGNMPRPRALAPLPVGPGPGLPFAPASVPPEAVWELARVLSILRDMPADHVVKRLADALIMWPSLHEGSLLRRIGEIFPTEIPPAPNPEPEEQPTKKKRGRPPGKKGKASEAAAAAAAAPAPDPRAMPPPAPSYTIPIPVTANGKKIATETDKVDKILTCTRCLKNFNPTWRATPASDPSSDATCAVKHPYKDFASGLVVTTPARKKNNYKTTWKWKCCGREVQSTSDELLMWPRKEDDRTAGWCFVGRHTVEPGVREKLGLKPGKGRKINDESNPGRKRRKVSDNTAETNGEPSAAEQPPQPPQPPANWSLPPQPGPSKPYTPPPQQPTTEVASHDSAPSPEEPTKRKRGRPKGSKAKAKPKSKVSKASLPLPSTEGTDAPAESSDGHGPEQQLMLEAEQHIRATAAQQDEDEDADGEPAVEQSTFWSEYAEPSAESASPAPNDDDDDDDDDEKEDEDADGDGDDDNDPAISAVDLSLLASATAAMDPTIGIAAASDTEQPAEKRKRGRPRGSKNAKIVAQSSENLQQKSPKVKPAEVTTATITTTNKRATRGAVLAVGENTAKPQPTTRRNATQPPPPPQPATTDNSSTQDESGNGDGNGEFEEMGQAPIASMGASPATGLGGTYGGLGVVDDSEQWFGTG